MPDYRTRGVILSSMKLGEADKIVRILSEKEGIIDAVAKGIRKTKSKFGGRLEPFTYSDLHLYQGRNLDIILQAETINPFKLIREDLRKVALASISCDLILRSQVDKSSERVLNLLLFFLSELERAKDGLKILLLIFETRLLSLLGYQPILDVCCLCGSPLEGRRFSFDFGGEGLVCGSCRPTTTASVSISGSSLLLLRWLFERSPRQWQEISDRSKGVAQVEELLEKYLAYHLEKKPKSYQFLRLMESAEGFSDN
ncbi:DNA repair protein RecO [Candidatus Hakubella thermalkaliphila]|nr:DNA repair protein RecO [Candidatus Hakubella thermalkaliphila]